MKAISLWQPWASLMALGAKTYETRGWDTKHRGLLLIHAAKRWTKPQREFAAFKVVRDALLEGGYHSPDLLPRGGVIACVELIETMPADRNAVARLDRIFGDFSEGRFMWRCRVVRAYKPMIPVVGRQGLFDVELAREVEES